MVWRLVMRVCHHLGFVSTVWKKHLPFILAICVAACFCSATQAQLTSFRVGSGFTNPLFATYAPGEPNTLYVVEKAGNVRPLNLTTGVIGSTFLNLPSFVTVTTDSERGLLGLAFDPNYATNNRFFVFYTDTVGALQVDRFTTSGGVPGSRTPIINIPHPGQSNHNGGWMGFSPVDGFLYIATGDGGSGNDPPGNAQNTNVLLGKMLQ